MKRGRKFTLGFIILVSVIFSFISPTEIKGNRSVGKNQEYIPKLASPSTYLIVTTNAIESNSNNLTDFIQYKESLGFSVEVITENEFGSATGQTRVLNIRNWLINNYESKDIEYILLIGNPDPDDYGVGGDSVGDIPMLMCYPRRGAGSDEESPTDYIYADLTGNWDTDGDGYHGEYGTISQDYDVDFEAEVYVGRIPVYNAEYSVLDDILERMITHYDKIGTEKNKILMPMAISNYYNEDYSGYPRTDGLDCPEEVYNDILYSSGMIDTVMYERSGLYPVPTSAPRYDMALNKNNFITEFNNGHGAIFWWAHGNETDAVRKYWYADDGDGVPEWDEMEWISLISSTDMGYLENDKPAFFYQSSCLNGKPENSANLGYALLKRGAAISTVSASRVSWYAVETWHSYFYDYYTDNTGLGYAYMDNLLSDKMTAGKALYLAKEEGGESWFSQSWMNKMDFNLYGDPSMYYWWESPPSPPPPPPTPPTPSDDGNDDDDNGDDVELSMLNILFISAVLIGAGVAIAIAIVMIVRKKGKLPGRDIIPPTPPPTPPTTPSEIPPSQTISELTTIPGLCTKCGKELKLGNKFCTNCGAEIIK